MKKLILASLMLLASCATVKPLYVKDGIQVYRATCNGLARDIGDCYALASEQCGGNFEVINSMEKESEFFVPATGSGVRRTVYQGNTKTTYVDPTFFPQVNSKMINRSLFFYCKK